MVGTATTQVVRTTLYTIRTFLTHTHTNDRAPTCRFFYFSYSNQNVSTSFCLGCQFFFQCVMMMMHEPFVLFFKVHPNIVHEGPLPFSFDDGIVDCCPHSRHPPHPPRRHSHH